MFARRHRGCHLERSASGVETRRALRRSGSWRGEDADFVLICGHFGLDPPARRRPAGFDYGLRPPLRMTDSSRHRSRTVVAKQNQPIQHNRRAGACSRRSREFSTAMAVLPARATSAYSTFAREWRRDQGPALRLDRIAWIATPRLAHCCAYPPKVAAPLPPSGRGDQGGSQRQKGREDACFGSFDIRILPPSPAVTPPSRREAKG